MASRGDIRKLVKAARRQGWTVERTSGGHLRFAPPRGAYIVVSFSPSDHRSWLNARARLRRAGLEV